MVFYTDWLDTAEQFPNVEEQLQFLKGILHFGLRDVSASPGDPLAYRLGFNTCKGSVETNNKKRKGGALGGAPEGNANRRKVESNQPKVESNQPTINVNVNDNVNGNVNVKGVKKAVAFTAPTLEQVQAYVKEKGYAMDAVRFHAYYTANGWKVGRNPMKNWKAAVVNWAQKDKPAARPTYDQMHPIGDFANEFSTL